MQCETERLIKIKEIISLLLL